MGGDLPDGKIISPHTEPISAKIHMLALYLQHFLKKGLQFLFLAWAIKKTDF